MTITLTWLCELHCSSPTIVCSPCFLHYLWIFLAAGTLLQLLFPHIVALYSFPSAACISLSFLVLSKTLSTFVALYRVCVALHTSAKDRLCPHLLWCVATNRSVTAPNCWQLCPLPSAVRAFPHCTAFHCSGERLRRWPTTLLKIVV